jgi:hypothetical protein
MECGELMISLIAVILFALSTNQPLDCVRDATDVYLYTGHGKIPIVNEEWDNWLALEGESVEISAETLPEDIQGHRNDYKLVGMQYGESIEIWVRVSNSTGLHYLFVFDDMTKDENGNIHPCGGWAVRVGE